MHNHLAILGIPSRTARNKRRSGGQYCEYELDLNPEIVLETRAEITEHIG